MPNLLIDDDTNLLAAEFVLGTLDSEERANAQSLLRLDHGFIAMVRIWERRLGELHLMVEPIEPGAEILARIKAKLAQLPPEEGPAGPPAVAATEPAPKEPDKPAALGADPEPAPAEPIQSAVPDGSDSEAPSDLAGAATATEDTPVEASESDAEVRLPEAVLRSERGPAESPGPVEPPPLPQPEVAPKPPDLREDKRSDPRVDMVRSRGRWRAFSLLLLLAVAALAGLVAAWRFAPERVPPAMRPAWLMTAIGVGATAARHPGPPAGAFDE